MLTILFDIDGTLVRTGGAGKAAMESALRSAFGIVELLDVVSYSGRTDFAIARDLLQAHGIEPSIANQYLLTETYLAALPHCLATYPGEICPGIPEVLAELAQKQDVLVGLLTGNVQVGAKKKRGHFGLWDHFRIGGYGDQLHNRDDVARSAIVAANTHLKYEVDPNRVWVIGDTPHDVSCARAIGAKAIAVATGWHSWEELQLCQADLTLHDLADTASLLNAWGLR